MPELPEVEFSARRLRHWLVGRRVVQARAQEGTPLRSQAAEDFCQAFQGAKATDVRRIGKQLFLEFDNQTTVLCHLGMTGKWRRLVMDAPASRWCRTSWLLDDGHRLEYVDPRRFGRLRALPASQVRTHPEIARLGPDALELCLDSPMFYGRVCVGQRAIKTVLMDQSVLAGVGNIYAAEALYLISMSPWQRAKEITKDEASTLANALRTVMLESLHREEGEEIRYLQEGKSENPFKVYGREGLPCERCAASIERAQQQARSTFWCPVCQPGLP